MNLADRLRANADLLLAMSQRRVPMDLRDLSALARDLQAEADAIEGAIARRAEAEFQIWRMAA